MKLNDLEDLFLHELQDLHNAEQQLVEALPKMAKAAQNPQLKSAFEQHHRETTEQVRRLQRIFEMLGESPGDKTCRGMEGLVEEGEDVISENADPSVRDAGLIVAAQKVEHYEIASYGSVCVFAEMLGHGEIKAILKQTMSEEEATDKKLTQLAERVVNLEAATR